MSHCAPIGDLPAGQTGRYELSGCEFETMCRSKHFVAPRPLRDSPEQRHEEFHEENVQEQRTLHEGSRVCGTGCFPVPYLQGNAPCNREDKPQSVSHQGRSSRLAVKEPAPSACPSPSKRNKLLRSSLSESPSEDGTRPGGPTNEAGIAIRCPLPPCGHGSPPAMTNLHLPVER